MGKKEKSLSDTMKAYYYLVIYDQKKKKKNSFKEEKQPQVVCKLQRHWN